MNKWTITGSVCLTYIKLLNDCVLISFDGYSVKFHIGKRYIKNRVKRNCIYLKNKKEKLNQSYTKTTNRHQQQPYQ